MINRYKKRYENDSRLNPVTAAIEVFDNKTDMWVLVSSVDINETYTESYSGNGGSFSGAGSSDSFDSSSSCGGD